MLVFRFVAMPSTAGWRGIRSYVALYHDPIFARAAINTLVFLIVGINLKMVVALFLSGFFTRQALVDQGGCRCCSSCPGRCRRSRPSCRCASCSIPNGA
jgi:ABC-type sugar transport system permease subunit